MGSSASPRSSPRSRLAQLAGSGTAVTLTFALPRLTAMTSALALANGKKGLVCSATTLLPAPGPRPWPWPWPWP